MCMELVVTLHRVIIIADVIYRCLAAKIHRYANNKKMNELRNSTYHYSENTLEFIETWLRI